MKHLLISSSRSRNIMTLGQYDILHTKKKINKKLTFSGLPTQNFLHVTENKGFFRPNKISVK